MKKIAIIGLGKWGRNLLREFSKISCVTKCHTRGNQKNISWLRKNYPKVVHTTSIRDILTDKNIDAVVISTPINSHFKIARNALEAGKHVFVEKPMTNTIVEAKQLLKIAKSKNLNLFVGHIFLHNEIFKKIKNHYYLIFILTLSAARLSETPGIEEPSPRALLISSSTLCPESAISP